MDLLGLSLNHRVTPIEVREGVAFQRKAGIDLLRHLGTRKGVAEAMLLSTCNRTELLVGHHPDLQGSHADVLLDLLRAARGFVPRERPRNYELFRNEGAVRHLFRVTAGLESQIVGESQILAQVKNAEGWARSAGTAGRVLHRLWERALRVGKRVRSETAIGEGALSASYAALELARKVFGRLDGKRVLVIGAGEVALLALDNLRGVSLGGLMLMNRTRRRAEELARRFGGEVRDLRALSRALVDADLVISSTSAPEPLASWRMMREVRAQRGGHRPLIILDLAVPRDFDERSARLDEVFLKNLDDLRDIVKQNTTQRLRELPRAEAIVEEELRTFFDWCRALEVEPTIRELRERFHAIRESELEVIRGALDAEAWERLDEFSRRLVNRLLHFPSENLRRHTGLRDREFIALVHELLTDEIPHPKASGAHSEPAGAEDRGPPC